MPSLKTIALSLATAAAVTGGVLFTADQGEASPPGRQTEKQTLAWLQAVERTDLAAVAEFLHPDIVLTQPMTFDGSQEPILVGTGREQVLDYFRSVFARTPRIGFFDTRISVTNGGTVSFVETKGDFTAADNRAYRNVYVWRLEWTPDGRLLRISDYYNPVILCDTWPENPSCARSATAGLVFTADQGEASPPGRQTEKRTLAFIRALEREDLAAVAEFQHPDIVLTHPFTFSGNQEPDIVFTGHEEALGYFRGMFATMAEIDFDDIRVSVTNGGTVAFVESKGDFVHADGRPYPNVYMSRLEWTPDGRILSIDDYYNPMTVCKNFPENPSCAPSGTAG